MDEILEYELYAAFKELIGLTVLMLLASQVNKPN